MSKGFITQHLTASPMQPDSPPDLEPESLTTRQPGWTAFFGDRAPIRIGELNLAFAALAPPNPRIDEATRLINDLQLRIGTGQPMPSVLQHFLARFPPEHDEQTPPLPSPQFVDSSGTLCDAGAGGAQALNYCVGLKARVLPHLDPQAGAHPPMPYSVYLINAWAPPLDRDASQLSRCFILTDWEGKSVLNGAKYRDFLNHMMGNAMEMAAHQFALQDRQGRIVVTDFGLARTLSLLDEAQRERALNLFNEAIQSALERHAGALAGARIVLPPALKGMLSSASSRGVALSFDYVAAPRQCREKDIVLCPWNPYMPLGIAHEDLHRPPCATYGATTTLAVAHLALCRAAARRPEEFSAALGRSSARPLQGTSAESAVAPRSWKDWLCCAGSRPKAKNPAPARSPAPS